MKIVLDVSTKSGSRYVLWSDGILTVARTEGHYLGEHEMHNTTGWEIDGDRVIFNVDEPYRAGYRSGTLTTSPVVRLLLTPAPDLCGCNHRCANTADEGRCFA